MAVGDSRRGAWDTADVVARLVLAEHFGELEKSQVYHGYNPDASDVGES